MLRILGNMDMFHLLCEYLPAGDIFSLELVNKSAFENCKILRKRRILSKRVEEYLGSRLLEKMKSYNIAISGSFILKAINAENWNAGDIDIYINVNDEYEKLIKSFPLSVEIRGRYENIINFHCGEEPIKRKYIERVFNCQNTEKKRVITIYNNIHHVPNRLPDTLPGKLSEETHQVIVVNDSFEKVFSLYDFDFVKNYYQNGALTIMKKHSIRRRKSFYYSTVQNRIEKYTKRGFILVDFLNNIYFIKKNIRKYNEVPCKFRSRNKHWADHGVSCKIFKKMKKFRFYYKHF